MADLNWDDLSPAAPDAKDLSWDELSVAPKDSSTLAGVAGSFAKGSNELAAGVGSFIQAPAASTLSGVLGAKALVQRKARDWAGITSDVASAEKDARNAADYAQWQREQNAGGVVSDAGKSLEEAGREGSGFWQARLAKDAPEMLRQQQAISDAEGVWGTLVAVAKNPQGLAGTVAASLPDMAVGAGVGMRAAKSAFTRAYSAELLSGATREVAKSAAEKAATSAASTAGVLSEASSSGLHGREGTYSAIMSLPEEKLADSPRYLELLNATGDKAAARKTLATELSDQVPLLSAAGTAAGTLIANKFFGLDSTAATLAGAANKTERMTAKEFAKRTAGDTAEEAIQGVPEDYVQHSAMVQADGSQKFDLGNTIISNAAGGFGMGAAGHGLGFAGSRARQSNAQAQQAEADLSSAGNADEAIDAATRLAESVGLNSDLDQLELATTALNQPAPQTEAPSLDERLGGVKDRLSGGELIAELRAIDPSLPQQFLSDFQIARNPNIDETQRSAALDRIEPLLVQSDPSAIPESDAHLPSWVKGQSVDALTDHLLGADEATFSRILRSSNMSDSQLTATLDAVADRLAAMPEEDVFKLGSYAAQAELDRRANEQATVDPYTAALQQLESQKSGQMESIVTQARDQQVDQANAMTTASGVDSGTPTAMESAFKATGQFSRTRPQTIQGRRADSITKYELEELSQNQAVSAVVRRSASVELAARQEGQPNAETQPAASAQPQGVQRGQSQETRQTTQEVLTQGSGLIGLTPAAQMPITELQRYAKSRGRVGDIARAEIAKRSAPAPQPTTETTTVTPTGNADLDSARAALAADGQDVSGLQIVHDSGADIAATGDKATKQESKIVKILAAVFKKRIVTLSGLKDDGFVVKSDRNVIYLNANAEQNSIAVLGHEITHLLKTEYPALYNALAAMVKANFKDMAAFREYYGDPKMSDERLLEEAVSDLVGNRMLEETFWSNTFAKLNALEGSKAPGIIQKFVDALLTVISRFKTLAGSRKGFKTDQWVENLDQIKVAAEDALAQYLHNIRTGVEPAAAGPDDAAITFASPKRPVADNAQQAKTVPPKEDEAKSNTGRGVNIEVAPDPRDTAAKEAFEKLSEANKKAVTYAVAEKVIPKLLSDMGLKGTLEYTIGGFEGGTAPSIIVHFDNATPYAQVREFAISSGALLRQQAAISYDENDTTSEGQTTFVYVEPSRVLSYEEQQHLFKEINGNYPAAKGFTGRNGLLVFGNFDSLNDDEFHNGIDKAVSEIESEVKFNTRMKRFLSDWHEPLNVEDTRYGTSNQTTARRPDDHGRQGFYHALQSESDQLVRSETARYSPARSDGAGSGGVREGNARTGYGSSQEGSVQVEGLHFSQEKRDSLDSNKYGSGLAGAEARRLGRESATPDQSKRIHFYVNEGTGVTAEAGVGYQAHAVKLNNLYDIKADQLGLYDQGAAKYSDLDDISNHAEQQAIAQGFDGIYYRGAQGDQGVAVLLGKHSVPVDYLGMGKQTTEVAPPMAPKSETKQAFEGLQQKVMDNKSLPGGEMTGADWKRLMPKLMPEVDVSHLQDGEKYYRDQLVQRPTTAKLASPARSLPKNFSVKDIPETVKIRIPVEVEETGETVYLERNAREALVESEADANRWKRLYNCLGKAA